MLQRLRTASLVSVVLATTGATGALAATTAAPPAPSAPIAVTPAASTPTLDCGTGLVATVCAVVLGPICHDRCEANTTTAASAAAVPSLRPVSAGSVVSGATGATGSPSTASPTLDCGTNLIGTVVCTILGLTICHIHFCGIDTAAAAMPALRLSTAEAARRAA